MPTAYVTSQYSRGFEVSKVRLLFLGFAGKPALHSALSHSRQLLSREFAQVPVSTLGGRVLRLFNVFYGLSRLPRLPVLGALQHAASINLALYLTSAPETLLR